jgi:LPS O-antigen subunit length determinant protein (WzzB/FepE family)
LLDFVISIIGAWLLRPKPNEGLWNCILRTMFEGLAICLAIAVAAFVAARLTVFLAAHQWISN